MSEGSRVFERVADELERLSKLSRLEARGTLRFALREAGFLPRNVTPRQMIVVLEKTLSSLLVKRGVREGATICHQIGILVRETMGMESSEGEASERVAARIARASVPPSIPPSAPGRGSAAPEGVKIPTGSFAPLPGYEKKIDE